MPARLEVSFFDETCERALPAAVFEDLPVAPLFRTADAFFATTLLVDLAAT